MLANDQGHPTQAVCSFLLEISKNKIEYVWYSEKYH